MISRSCWFFIVLFLSALSLTSHALTDSTLIHDQTGHVIDLKNHPGKWLVINYWAPWCAPCKKEIPELNQFYHTYNKTVLVYGINYDFPNADELRKLASTMHIQYPLLLEDPSKLLGIPDIQGLPMSFVFNPQGKLVTTLVGPQTSKTLKLATLH